jgi:hypothetical protein
MLRLFKEITGFALLVIILFTLPFSGACKKQGLLVVAPYMPPDYYSCIEADAGGLVFAYFAGYGNISAAENTYNNKYYVFKNLEIKDWMLTELDKGWLWLESGVKCVLVNIDDMKAFKIGDRIDVVGYNTGVDSSPTPGLLFTNCIVMPTGLVKLPTVEGAFSIGY